MKQKMAAWIDVTPKLEQGLKIVNQIDTGKFRLFISRICQTLQIGIHKKIFSDDEEEKLMASLDLSKDDLSLLLNTIMLIYFQAAYNSIKPSSMEALMKESFGIEEDKILIFSNAWLTYGKGIINNLRDTSIFPTQVKDIHWKLNIQASSSAISKSVQPTALLQLGLEGDLNSKFTVEFDKNNLVELYNNLEKIQRQLDTLK